MVLRRTVSQLLLLSALGTLLYAADSLPPITAPAANEVEALPVSPAPAIWPLISDVQLTSLHPARVYPGCKVAPLSEIGDPQALAFEKNAETDPTDVDDLMPHTAQALDNFKDMVTSAGGTFELKSAYRPPAYQAHLHEVWVKWVKELHNNKSKACRALREDVGAEFKLHQLLVKQQPVPSSDHVLGLAFDAAVAMPRGARLNGKRVTVDKLAALAGIKRPTIRKDPVHFKLIPERPVAISYAATPSL